MKDRATTRLLRALAVVLAGLLVAVTAGAWVRAARPADRYTDRSKNLRRVDWHATLAPDGSLAVIVRYSFLPAAFETTVAASARGLVLPDGAVRLRIGGRPAAATYGSERVVVPERLEVELAYEVPGGARRIGDRVLIDVSAVAPLSYLDSDFGYAEVRGTLTVASSADAGGDVRAPGARIVRVDRDGPVLAFTGAVSTYDGASVVALLPVPAAPDAARAAEEVDGAGDAPSRFDKAADARSEGRVPDGVPQEVGPAPLLVAVVITVEVVGLGLWLVLLRRRHLRRLAAAASIVPEELSEPPSGIDPDVVAMLTASSTGTVATREAISANVLAMVHRGTIRLESLDSRRFLLRIPAGAQGNTATERAILSELRPQGQSGVPVTLEGPPLWGRGEQPWLALAERDIRRRARSARLIARAVRPGVFVPAMLLVPVTALLGSGSDSRVVGPGVAALVAAAALAGLVAFTAPLELTDTGLARRAEGLSFARYLRAARALDQLGAPAVLTRGPYLVYGAAVGAAPVAAQDVGVGRVLPVVEPAAEPRSSS